MQRGVAKSGDLQLPRRADTCTVGLNRDIGHILCRHSNHKWTTNRSVRRSLVSRWSCIRIIGSVEWLTAGDSSETKHWSEGDVSHSYICRGLSDGIPFCGCFPTISFNRDIYILSPMQLSNAVACLLECASIGRVASVISSHHLLPEAFQEIQINLLATS